jgi:peptidoglycan/xylan/chitin deacetylase (PgdA/CDA1 family)
MFHHFHGDAHGPSQGSLSAEGFRAMIEWLGRDRFLPAHEWLERSLAGTLPDDALCATFDDNLRCQFDVAWPVMREMGLTGFFFAQTSVIEGDLNKLEIYRHFRHTCFASIDEFYGVFHRAVATSPYGDEVASRLPKLDPENAWPDFPVYTAADRVFRVVRDVVLGQARYEEVMDGMVAEAKLDFSELAPLLWMDAPALRMLHESGNVIGLHSHTHPTRLALLPAAEQEWEYGRNRDVIEAITGERPRTVAHPANDYDAVTLGILRQMDIVHGFRANMSLRPHSELEWPREDHGQVLADMRAAGAPAPH